VIAITVVVILSVPVPVSVSMLVIIMAMPVMVAFSVSMLMRRIDLVVPAVRNKIDGPAARVVFVAMLGPMLFMPRRYMKIERLRWLDDDRRRRRKCHYWVRQQHLRLGQAAADADLSVDPGDVHIDSRTHPG
jgi:hypothetical protein